MHGIFQVETDDDCDPQGFTQSRSKLCHQSLLPCRYDITNPRALPDIDGILRQSADVFTGTAAAGLSSTDLLPCRPISTAPDPRTTPGINGLSERRVPRLWQALQTSPSKSSWPC